MNKNFNDLTILLVSFKSDEQILRLISKLDTRIKIIIVENSLNKTLKNYIEKKYNNIKVLIPKTNKGWGAGINYAIKKIRSKYIITLDCDVSITSKNIYTLLQKAKKLDSFGVLMPKIYKQKYKDLIIGYDKKNKLSILRFNTGCVMLFKRETFLEMGLFDENYFLYFEETDFFTKCIRNNKKIYLYEKFKIKHDGSRSINLEYKDEYMIFRNWHYCWSKFYYYKKNYNYLTALSKTFPNLKKSLIGIFKNIIFGNTLKFKLNSAEFMGLINSYFSMKSKHRMNIDID
jgi:N-acetylglucosaminyl-diphospho-decaprenol L-rhamnosyltransferase